MLPGSRQGHCWPLLPYVYCLPRQKQSTVHPGSSPRLRGTENQGDHVWRMVRFIPAPAGNGVMCSAIFWCSSVHPRACGERLCIHVSDVRTRGSSPRLRGTVEVHLRLLSLCRFIPAPAGNGAVAPSPGCSSTVHPRACGERDFVAAALRSLSGSSPRLRGTGLLAVVFHCDSRFIPAPAGNGGSYYGPRYGDSVHPRACGERFDRSRR